MILIILIKKTNFLIDTNNHNKEYISIKLIKRCVILSN